MRDKLKITLRGAIVFLGIAILLGSYQISNAIKSLNDGPNYEDQFNWFNYNLEKLVNILEKNQ